MTCSPLQQPGFATTPLLRRETIAFKSILQRLSSTPLLTSVFVELKPGYREWSGLSHACGYPKPSGCSTIAPPRLLPDATSICLLALSFLSRRLLPTVRLLRRRRDRSIRGSIRGSFPVPNGRSRFAIAACVWPGSIGRRHDGGDQR